MGTVEANRAHTALAEMEDMGFVHATITQNIDNLHQKAGSKTVYEYHGNSRELTCMQCHKKHRIEEISLETMPPRCSSCNGILKPDFIFFGESIPEPAASLSHKEAYNSDLFLVIGTTGEIMPAALIPMEAKRNGATILEINIQPSHYTDSITDIFLQGKATEMMDGLLQTLKGS
jgi:NAD-dependent deacetylase